MQEVMLKTHLIVSGVHDEYSIDWCGHIINTKPLLKNGLPIFVIVGSKSRMELNTINIKLIEESAKQLTHPKGREAVTIDVARIYIKEEDGKETFLGKVVHKHIKKYQQIYDKFGYI